MRKAFNMRGEKNTERKQPGENSVTEEILKKYH